MLCSYGAEQGSIAILVHEPGVGAGIKQRLNGGGVALTCGVHQGSKVTAFALIVLGLGAFQTHPLAKLGMMLSETDLARHTRIVVGSDTDARPQGGNGRPVEAGSRWNAGGIDTALAALEAGLGYAWLPRNRVDKLVSTGQLQLLGTSAQYHRRKDFYLVHARQASPGVGASSLSSLLHSHAALMLQIGVGLN